MSKITVIQLLNKIANGEEVPKRIKFDGTIWEYNKTAYDYIDTGSTRIAFFTKLVVYSKGWLDGTVEIIEDKEDINIQDIEELTYKGGKIGYGSTRQFTDDVGDYCPAINSILDSVGIKINEIIRAVKQLDKTKEDK